MAILFCLVPAVAQSNNDKTIEITVVKNDNLINICKKYLDKPSLWPEIAKVNHLKDQNLIYQGQQLLIPVRLLRGLPVDGRVAFLRGDVTIRLAKKDGWKALKIDDVVRQGSVIRTGSESAVEIIFGDGTSFFQRPDTIIDVKRSRRKSDTMLWQRFVLQGGQLLLKIRKSLGRESRIEVQTPAAVAVARGTAFRVSVDDRQGMTSEVIQGKIGVQARKQQVFLKEGEGTRVNKGEPPLPPRKLLASPQPLDLVTIYQMMPLRIKFQDVDGAVAYRVMLSTDAEGKNIVREKIIRSGNSWELQGLDDGEYYLHSRSIDKVGIEGFSGAGQKLQVRINPLPPFLQNPVDGKQYKRKEMSFNWLKVHHAVRYALEISANREFSEGTVKKFATDETSYNHTLSEFGTYYFRVRSIAADGFEGIWSDSLKFTLVPPPPAPPVDKPEVNKNELYIRWKDQGAKMTYRCQIAREESFLNILAEQKIDKPEIIFPKPVEPGIYYVRTSTIDSEGEEGGFSVPQTFEIKRNNTKWVAIGSGGLLVLLLLILH